ncbi:MAG: tripartite tricarboxylate transporter substrate binding protein [Casimicrobium sp.]
MNKPQLYRRRFTFSLFASAALGPPAWAQTALPEVLSLVAPYPAGGASDVVARTLQPTMAKAMGKTIVVENISGVSGAIGAQKVLSATVPGQSMLVGSPNECILAPLALKVIKYKPQDFRLVAHVATAGIVLFARPDFPANSIDELVKLSKAPGAKPFTHASTGKGSSYHLLSETFSEKLNLNLVQVQYRGGAPAIQDLMGGSVDLLFGPVIPQYLQMVETGRMKIIGSATAARLPSQPKVQAFGEIATLKDTYFDAWVGIFVPVGTATDLAERMGKAAYEAATSPAFQKVLTASGNSAGSVMTLEQAAAFYQRETVRYQQIAQKIKLDAE